MRATLERRRKLSTRQKKFFSTTRSTQQYKDSSTFSSHIRFTLGDMYIICVKDYQFFNGITFYFVYYNSTQMRVFNIWMCFILFRPPLAKHSGQSLWRFGTVLVHRGLSKLVQSACSDDNHNGRFASGEGITLCCTYTMVHK